MSTPETALSLQPLSMPAAGGCSGGGGPPVAAIAAGKGAAFAFAFAFAAAALRKRWTFALAPRAMDVSQQKGKARLELGQSGWCK